uniref:Uncharacterized protein n=1 Tax=Rhizophora mucronata TaxID=61149 RepID=A0A2P2IY98_RHIMU
MHQNVLDKILYFVLQPAWQEQNKLCLEEPKSNSSLKIYHCQMCGIRISLTFTTL